MSFSATITLAAAGADTGPFNLFSNVDGYVTAFETNVSKLDLLDGYISTNVPDDTSSVRVTSNNIICSNYIDMGVDDPTVTVYERCLDGFIAYVESSTADAVRTKDAGGQCYNAIDSGLLTAMEIAHPGMTYVPSLYNVPTIDCPCV